MKKLLLQVCLPISLGLLTQAGIAAEAHTPTALHKIGAGMDVHTTIIRTKNPVYDYVKVYPGSNMSGTCQKIGPSIGQTEGWVTDYFKITTGDNIFASMPLNPYSCAVEEHTVGSTRETITAKYTLIHNDYHVYDSDPNPSYVSF